MSGFDRYNVTFTDLKNAFTPDFLEPLGFESFEDLREAMDLEEPWEFFSDNGDHFVERNIKKYDSALEMYRAARRRKGY